MGRRNRDSNGEVLIKLVAKLPWWLAFLLAALSYPVLHALASSPLPPVKPGSIPLVSMFVRAFATAGQYVAPLIFAAGGIVSLYVRRDRKQLLERVASMPTVETVNGLTWGEFERLVGEVFRRKSYTVSETGQSGPDGGVDLELRQGKELHLVQCKQWRAQRVGVAIVRELAGVMASRGAAGGFVVTSGAFTPDAEDFARGSNITLIGGPQLAALIDDAKRSTTVLQRDQGTVSQQAHVSCPVCSSSMVRRTARRGTNAGGEFWGCSKYPTCRGTLDVA